MAAIANPLIPRQYNIEVGPWDATGAPARLVALSDLGTNNTYMKCRLIGPPTNMYAGLLFTTDVFRSTSTETLPNENNLFLINLEEFRVRFLPVTEVPQNNCQPLSTYGQYPLHETGSISWLKWNRIFQLENAAGDTVMIRAVQNPVIAEAPGTPPPQHRHHGDPTKRITPIHKDVHNLMLQLKNQHEDMHNLLSRLKHAD